MATEKLDYYEARELADLLLKIENPEEDNDVTEQALADKWGISLETFHEIAAGIFSKIDFGISPITQTPYAGISNGNMWIAKKEVQQQFIHAIINWATEGEDIPKGSKGFMRSITSGGKPEYDISITLPKKTAKSKKAETSNS